MTQPSIAGLTKIFAKIGFLSFGGPAGQIALMHRSLVEEQAWLSEKSFLTGTSFCMLLPGPEAMQLATYAGWRLHGTIGGLIAGLLFVMPGALVVLALSLIYAYFGDAPLMAAIFLGVKAAVLVIVLEALLRVSRKALKGTLAWVLAAAAFVGIFFLDLPFPLIVLASAVIGYMASQDVPTLEQAPSAVPFANTLKTVLIWLTIWWAPLLFMLLLMEESTLTDIALFFSKLAVVTFGGAYAVLAYMGQEVVTGFGWLTAGEMMDGLGLAETTPGPLILVTEFVGFLAAFRDGGLLIGFLGAALTLWVTFAPCFLWIFAGAPYIAAISANARLSSALNAVTAAVVGVILNLSLWFALNVFFADVQATRMGPIRLWTPDLTSFDWRVPVIALLCAVALLKLHWNLFLVLLIAAGLGFGLSLF